MLTLTIEGRAFQGLLYTGVDTSVVSFTHWPKTWPFQESDTDLKGVGTAHAPLKNSRFLTWRDQEGHSGVVRPFIFPHILVNLCGRDILDGMGAVLTTQPVQKNAKGQRFLSW